MVIRKKKQLNKVKLNLENWSFLLDMDNEFAIAETLPFKEIPNYKTNLMIKFYKKAIHLAKEFFTTNNIDKKKINKLKIIFDNSLGECDFSVKNSTDCLANFEDPINKIDLLYCISKEGIKLTKNNNDNTAYFKYLIETGFKDLCHMLLFYYKIKLNDRNRGRGKSKPGGRKKSFPNKFLKYINDNYLLLKRKVIFNLLRDSQHQLNITSIKLKRKIAPLDHEVLEKLNQILLNLSVISYEYKRSNDVNSNRIVFHFDNNKQHTMTMKNFSDLKSLLKKNRKTPLIRINS